MNFMKTEWNTYFLLDANLLVYVLDSSDEFKHAIANELFESALSSEMRFAVTTQVLAETLNVFIKHNYFNGAINPDYVKLFMSDLINIEAIPKLAIPPVAVLRAYEIHLASGAPFYDSLLAATMKNHGVTTIYTEDKHFHKIEGIKVVNPFLSQRVNKP